MVAVSRRESLAVCGWGFPKDACEKSIPPKVHPSHLCTASDTPGEAHLGNTVSFQTTSVYLDNCGLVR